MFSAILLIVISLTQALSTNPNILRTQTPARVSENSVFSTQMKEKDIFNVLNRLENFYEHKSIAQPKSNIRITEDLLLNTASRNNKILRASDRFLRKRKAEKNGILLRTLRRKFHYNALDAKNLLRQLRTDQILDLLKKVTKPSNYPGLRTISQPVNKPLPKRGHAGVHRSSSELSKEETDPFRPGKVHYGESSIETDLDILKYGVYPKPAPAYSFYDFWTYKKPYIPGECPGNSVRVGALCMELPPH